MRYGLQIKFDWLSDWLMQQSWLLESKWFWHSLLRPNALYSRCVFSFSSVFMTVLYLLLCFLLLSLSPLAVSCLVTLCLTFSLSLSTSLSPSVSPDGNMFIYYWYSDWAGFPPPCCPIFPQPALLHQSPHETHQHTHTQAHKCVCVCVCDKSCDNLECLLRFLSVCVCVLCVWVFI